jgi:hypothetical protein
MYTWSKGADAVLEHTAVDWDGVWSLLYAAGKGAFRLSLQLPLGPGAELAYAAMDICEARDEVSWAHPEVPMTAIAVDLGAVGPVVDVQAAAAVLVGLLDAALERLSVLQDADLDPDVRSLSRRTTWKVRTAHEAITGLAR